MILSTCSVYLAKRRTDKAAFQRFQVFSTNRTAWIWRTGTFFVSTDRRRHMDTTDHLPLAHARGVKYQTLTTCTISMFTFQSGGAWEQGYARPLLCEECDSSIICNIPYFPHSTSANDVFSTATRALTIFSYVGALSVLSQALNIFNWHILASR